MLPRIGIQWVASAERMLEGFSSDRDAHDYLWDVRRLALTAISSWILLFMSVSSAGQVLASPESMVWVENSKQFIISNAASGRLIAWDGQEQYEYFGDEAMGSHGLVTVEGVLYACYRNELIGYDLDSGSEVDRLKLESARFLNGLTSDDEGHLFVTDFSKREIYRIELSKEGMTDSRSLTSLNRIPNGIHFKDGLLQVLTWGRNADILFLEPESGTVVETIETEVDNLEGIYEDAEGHVLITSWTPPGVYRLEKEGLIPADDIRLDHLKPTGLAESAQGELFILGSDKERMGFPSRKAKKDRIPGIQFQAFPNPMVVNSLLSYGLNEDGQVSIDLYDAKGVLMATLYNGNQNAGEHQFIIRRTGLASGLYFVHIQTPERQETVPLTMVD